ncbi:MAG: polysaccharide biosynthesis C-terminal domain-containing protein, partial [Candidatus Omnitrophica bacterium]|nr:polysaccharide biosynthesis C-terminal domain-containing protein [Candidatus Omnitrophota bacterium]
DKLKGILKFGYKVQIINLGSWINQNLDKFLISYFLTVNFVAFYDFAQKITNAARSICISIIGPVIPAASEINAIGNRHDLRKLFFNGMKLLFAVAVPLFFLVLINAKDIISLWLGKGFEMTVITLIILICGAFVNILTGIGTSIVRGINKPGLEVRYACLYLFLNVFLSIFLILRIGFYGAAIGTTLSSIISSVYFLIIFAKKIEISFKDFVSKMLLKPLTVSLFLLAMFYVFQSVFFYEPDISHRLYHLKCIFLRSSVFIVIFFCVLFFTRYYDFKHVREALFSVIKGRKAL